MKKVLVFVGIMMAITTFGCAKSSTITPEEALTLIEENEAVLVDVRTAEEYQSEHIEGAVLLPLDRLEEDVDSLLPDKKRTVIVYCRRGNRSKTAVRLLKELGYKNVYDVGGIESWPYSTVKE